MRPGSRGHPAGFFELRLCVVSGGNQRISRSRPTATSTSAFWSLRMKLGLASTKCGSWYPFASGSTVTWSPPTSRARDARSSVVVMMLSLPCACAVNGCRNVARRRMTAMLRVMGRSTRILKNASTLNLQLPRQRDALEVGNWKLGVDKHPSNLKRVRAVHPDREHQLEQHFVRRRVGCVPDTTILPAHLAELTGPEAEDE